jgi:hypothetical protein
MVIFNSFLFVYQRVIDIPTVAFGPMLNKWHFDHLRATALRATASDTYANVAPQPHKGVPGLVNLGVARHNGLVEGNTLWLFSSSPWKITIFKNGKPSINGPFSMAMLNNQRVSDVTGNHHGIFP